MTYRKLFLLLSAISTLMLAGVWWDSQWKYNSVYISASVGRPTFLLSCHAGTLELSFRTPLRPDTLVPELIRFPRESPAAGVMGRFEVERITAEKDDMPRLGLSGGETAWRVAIPVWVPWLVFIGLAFLFTRCMQRRAAAAREKYLAVAGRGDAA